MTSRNRKVNLMQPGNISSNLIYNYHLQLQGIKSNLFTLTSADLTSPIQSQPVSLFKHGVIICSISLLVWMSRKYLETKKKMWTCIIFSIFQLNQPSSTLTNEVTQANIISLKRMRWHLSFKYADILGYKKLCIHCDPCEDNFLI